MRNDNMNKKLMKFNRDVRNLIPDKYNQIELVDEIANDELDYYISISNRSDGKSFNYINYFVEFQQKFGVGFCLIARHFEIRDAYREFLEELFYARPNLDSDRLFMKRNNDMIIVVYKNENIGVIVDLNNATDLKYHSNFLKHFPIIIYDEFLAIEGDYLVDEWEKLKTIYESIDRNGGDIPVIKFPKMILLGNAVNFKSPLLANLNIFNKLERHPINTARIYDNIYLEMRRNDNANDVRNTRAFKSENDAMTTAKFKMNNFKIADENLRNNILKHSDRYYIKTDKYYIKVLFNKDNYLSILSVEPTAENYQFCTELNDVKNDVVYLNPERFFDDMHHRKYYKQSNLYFDNAYSKDYVLEMTNLSDLKINVLTGKYLALYNKNESQFNYNQRVFKDNYEERTKRYLINKFS